MSTFGTVTVRWVEKEMIYLSGGLGPYRIDALDDFFFEPTQDFYALVGSGDTTKLNQAVRTLAKYIGSPTAPVIEEWDGSVDPLIIADYDWATDKKPPGMIRYLGPNHSRISLNITNKHSPLIMGAILAHELTHHFLDFKNIRHPETEANEQLTDLATAYLGLGKLTLNGYEPISWTQERKGKAVTHTYRVGYLLPEDMALILCEVCRFRSIPAAAALKNLTPQAVELFNAAERASDDFQRKKKLIGQRQCPRCGEFAEFAFGDDDDVYCSKCGWEWIAIIKYVAAQSCQTATAAHTANQTEHRAFTRWIRRIIG